MRRLILRPGAIGDCILSLPALECLGTSYTEVWVPSPVVPLVRSADRVRSIASTGLDQMGLHGVEPRPGLLEELRTFDSIVSWYGSNRPDFREALEGLGVPVRFYPALPHAGHAADVFLEQAGCPGIAIPRIHVASAPRRSLAIIHPFSGSPRKNWPLDRFRDLASQVPMEVAWSAGPEEPLADAVRFDDLYQLATWLATARLYIGNDSGITHLAAAVGTPVIALFGPTDPARWGPRGSDVRIIHQELSSITVHQVLSVALAQWK